MPRIHLRSISLRIGIVISRHTFDSKSFEVINGSFLSSLMTKSQSTVTVNKIYITFKRIAKDPLNY